MTTAAILLAVILTAQTRPPQIVLIHRDTVKPGSEAAYRAVEEDAARICAELDCPHPHFALESLTAPKEVWWLNAFDSEAEKQRVVDAYQRNRALTDALAGITKRREGLLTTEDEFLASYRPDPSLAGTWKVAGVRSFLVTVTRREPKKTGSVFQAPDGTWFVFKALTSGEEDRATVVMDSETRVFAVRPYWGLPAREWIAADPEFWKANPAAKPR